MEFAFNAKDQTGQLVQGSIDAPSEDQAILILQNKNLYIVNLEIVQKGVTKKDLLGFLSGPRRKDVVVFTRQLATLVGADVPLLEALITLTNQTDKESFKKIISTITASVEGGASLSLALSEHNAVFDKFYVSLVKVGEVSGRMQQTLDYLADYLERSAELNRKIRGAMTYPIFVLGLMLAITSYLMTSVVPQLLTAITEAGVKEFPLPTRVLMAVTSTFTKYGPLTLIILVVVAIYLYYYFRSEAGALRWDRMIIKMPQFGRIAQSFYLSRISETLSTLVKAGVPILDALSITADVVGNRVYQNILLAARASVQAGGNISQTFREFPEIPHLVSSMLETGEKTGRTAQMLDNILKFYKNEVDSAVQNLSQLIEPILMVILGIGVAIIVSAVLLPLFSMVNAGG